MKEDLVEFGSACSGPCLLCACAGSGCLAGHGDDDFEPATVEQLELTLKTGTYGGNPRLRGLEDYELDMVREELKRRRTSWGTGNGSGS